MLVDGEKYACEACVRGHRVSSCQHADRPLQHINKKGRPVSQCPHCRGLRKSRSTHAACECGTKGHKKEDHGDALETRSDPGAQSRCCCSHGQRCTCALKKDPLEGVAEMNPPAVPGALGRSGSNKKPRLAKAGSDTNIGSFIDRPSSSHDNMSHPLGMPFKVPIPHSAPNKTTARRLTDSLPTLKRKMPHSPSVGSAGPRAKLRTSKSEHGSPGPRDSTQMPSLPFDFTLDPIPAFDFPPTFYTPQEEPPNLASFNTSPPNEWPAFDTAFEEYTTYHHPNHPYPSFDQNPLAASSSGEVSEVSDYLSSRPQLSAANSDDSNIRRLSPAMYPGISAASSSLASEENLGSQVQLAMQRAAKPKPSNISSESIASQLSHTSYKSLPQGALSHKTSPMAQHLDGMSRNESMEEVFLPPTSSPKVNSGPFSPTSAPVHKMTIVTANTALRPPTSSPTQLHFTDQLSPSGYNVAVPQHEERSFHPTEVGPADFSQGPPVSQAQRYAQQNQAVQVHHNMAMSQATQPDFSPTGRPPHMPVKPVELTPAEFGQPDPVRQQSTQRQQRPQVARSHSSQSQVSVARSPAIGGTEDFRKQGFSVQDAQRLAHPRSSNLTQDLMSPGSYDQAGISMYDLHHFTHPDSASEPSSGPSSAGHEARTDPFKHMGAFTPAQGPRHHHPHQDQRLAYPTTPTDALSGLTIPQASSATSTPLHDPPRAGPGAAAKLTPGGGDGRLASGVGEAKIFWAGGLGFGNERAELNKSAGSFISQQEIEGAAAYWGHAV